MNRKYGCIPDDEDKRDHMFALGRSALSQFLTAPISLLESLPPVQDQGQEGSCIAHGGDEALAFNVISEGGSWVPLSRQWIYYMSRKAEGDVSSDGGAQIRTMMKVLAGGVPAESDWPYSPSKMFTEPPPNLAPVCRATEYQRVSTNADAIKTALFVGHPVVIGVNLYKQFESDQAAHDGVITMPSGSSIGGHCMLLVGAGQKPGMFTVRNSWGPDWGDEGNCYLPESYLAKEGSDCWVVTSLNS